VFEGGRTAAAAGSGRDWRESLVLGGRSAGVSDYAKWTNNDAVKLV